MQLLTTIILGTLCMVASAMPRQKRMVGATLANRGQFPYVVLVRRPGYECSGSIISPHWVLTAAHCIAKTNPARFKITAGTISDWYGGDEKDKHVQHRRVTKAIAHERYRRFTNDSTDTTFYDIGLLRVNKPFRMTDFVQSVPLTDLRPPYTKPCYAIGFGSSDISPEDWEKLKEDPAHPNRVKRSEPLRFYEVGVPSYKLPDYGPKPCRLLRDMRFKETYQLCSVGGAPNTTHLYVGDSGGPLVCNGVQVGVYVLSEPKMVDGSLHIIEVHTSVKSFIDWIKQHTSEPSETPLIASTLQAGPTNKDINDITSPTVFSTVPKDKWPTTVDKVTTLTRSSNSGPPRRNQNPKTAPYLGSKTSESNDYSFVFPN